MEQLYGEEIDKYVAELRKNAQAFFAQAGQKNIEVYRIEKFTPVQIDEAHQGKFYDGDSYVIVKQANKSYDIHFWEGVDSTADETGSAAALAVELSENLKLPSRHHLELMHEESDLFLSYYKSGVQYLHGGVESGFRHVVKEEVEPTLLQIKGRRYPRVFPVPISGSSLNQNDCFILDLGQEIYYWAGSNANQFEKVAAMNFAVNLKNMERKGKPTLIYPQTMGGESEQKFWTTLGGQVEVKAGALDEESKSVNANERLEYRLWKLSDASGKVEASQIKERPLTKSMLVTTDTFILEMYDKIYVWQGKNSSVQEKRAGMTLAAKYKTEWKKPAGTHITRLPEGTEDALFMSYFEGYYKCELTEFGQGKGLDLSTTANQDISKITNLHLKAASLAMDHLGQNPTVKIYAVNTDLTAYEEVVDPQEFGKFFKESVYIVDVNGDDHRYMICWMGPRLSGEQMAKTSTLQDKMCNYELSSNMFRMRVNAYQEPEDFLQFFPKGFTILQGPRSTMTEYYFKLKVHGAMFRIQAPYGSGARAIEQHGRSAKHLCSGESFVVFGEELKEGFTWNGVGANEAEIKTAQILLEEGFQIQLPKKTHIKEGQESGDFWLQVKGKQDYDLVKQHMIVNSVFEPVMFEISNQSGFMNMKPIPAFSQECLLAEDVYLLDCYHELFVWVGTYANKFEVHGAYSRASKYIEALKDGRKKEDVQIIEIAPTQEPPLFKVQFPNWSTAYSQKWIDSKHLEKLMEEHAKPVSANPFDGFLDPTTNKFAYADLKGQFPAGVKGNKKEAYLTDEEFQTVFKVTPQAFGALKDWKQSDLKKKVGLF